MTTAEAPAGILLANAVTPGLAKCPIRRSELHNVRKNQQYFTQAFRHCKLLQAYSCCGLNSSVHTPLPCYVNTPNLFIILGDCKDLLTVGKLLLNSAVA